MRKWRRPPKPRAGADSLVPSVAETLRATEAVAGIGESFLTYYDDIIISTGRRNDEAYTLLENLLRVVDLGAS